MKIVLIIAIALIAILTFLCLLRAVIGPRITDRILANNMVGTMTMLCIAILSWMLNEPYLLDVCIVYAMLSFVAVVVYTRITISRHKKMKAEKEKLAKAEANNREGEEV